MSQFVHLHLHTQYSLLDGTTQIAPLIDQAKAFGMPAVAITDHGNLFGAIKFYQTAQKAGIKPILGCEAYIAPKSRLDREAQGVQEDDYTTGGATTPYYHLILLAQNETGYKNLMNLVSLSNLEGFYYKPRMDKDTLSQHHAGLIALSGCLRGEVPYLLARGMEKEAVAAARDYQDIFGRENFFIEIQDNGLDAQRMANRQLTALARAHEMPLAGTNDCHYLHPGDAHAHDVMLCLQTGKTINMPHRMRFDTQQLYFKSPEEMIRGLGEIPEAITNTVRIAEMIDLRLKFGEIHLPHYTAPGGVSRETYLETLAREGLARRQAKSGCAFPTADYEARLTREMGVINAMGYAGYFLIVWDIIRYAREHGIPVGPGRGSAAGSLVAYALSITDMDPLAHGLLFERFLNPERISMPDIDMDFCVDRREEVLRYVTQKYGADHVAQIITFGTMAAKAALRDVGRVLEIPYADADRLAKLVPNTLAITLDEAIAQEPKLHQAATDDPRVGEMIALARNLEGLTRHASIHAAGVVISERPLTDVVPLYRGAKGEVVTQYAMDDLEKIGLVKFDFLGLRTLTVIDHAVRWINRARAAVGRLPFVVADLPLDDAETYALLGTGESAGIFQLESRGMRELLVKMRPETFEDIVALLALYRPGPLGSGMVDDFIKRKRGQTKIQYDLPQMEPILATTYGVIVYQEQVMQIANVLAGFSLGEADLLRRAMGKKKPEEMATQKARFVDGAKARGVAQAKAEQIFDRMEYFAGYGFNKSHSAAYALVTYQTAYLKCHHPLEFMTALLTCEAGNADKVVQHISACRGMNIRILPPDVNESEHDFTVTAEGIRFGLAAIKGVGSAAIEMILAARLAGRAFTSLFDFCMRIDPRRCNRRVIESLIHCGAFDSTGARRAALSEALDAIMQAGTQAKKQKESGQRSIFGEMEAQAPALPDLPEWDETKRAQMEKETVGFYITSHPLDRHQALLARWAVTPTANLGEIEGERAARICGLVVSAKVTTTRRGDKMAYLRVEDLTGSAEVIVFPDLYENVAALLKQEVPLLISGTLDMGEKGTKIKATEIFPLREGVGDRGGPIQDDLSRDDAPKTTHAPVSLVEKAQTRTTPMAQARGAPAQETGGIILALSASVGPADLQDLKAILLRHPGRHAVRLRIQTGATSETTIAIPFGVDISGPMRDEIARRFQGDVRL